MAFYVGVISRGQQILTQWIKTYLPLEEVLINHRPDWLEGLEIDIYLPKMKVAFEFQGAQHYVETFGVSPGPQMDRDRRKVWMCKRRGVSIHTVTAFDLTRSTVRRLGLATLHSKHQARHAVELTRPSDEVFSRLMRVSARYQLALRRIDQVTTRNVRSRAVKKVTRNGLVQLGRHYDHFLKTHPDGDYQQYIAWRDRRSS